MQATLISSISTWQDTAVQLQQVLPSHLLVALHHQQQLILLSIINNININNNSRESSLELAPPIHLALAVAHR